MARLWDVALVLLNTAAEAFDKQQDDPPEYRWVADGATPIMDFGVESSLVVMWDGLRTGLAAEGLASGGASASARGLDASSTMSGNYSVYVWRPAPMPDDAGNAPSIEELSAAARQQLDDAYLVFRTFLVGFGEGTLLGACGDAAIVDQVPIGPEGGIEGSRLRIAVGL